MSRTKNVTLGIIAVFMMIYMALIGLDFYITQSNKLQLERVLPRSVVHALKVGMETSSEAQVQNVLSEELETALSGADSIQTKLRAVDLQKGILSVEASIDYRLLNGKKKTITTEKTVIMEKEIPIEPRVTVTFLVDEEVYKEYQLVQGENCPMPVLSSKYFAGWVEYGSSSNKVVQNIGKVWSDKVYVAVAK